MSRRVVKTIIKKFDQNLDNSIHSNLARSFNYIERAIPFVQGLNGPVAPLSISKGRIPGGANIFTPFQLMSADVGMGMKKGGMKKGGRSVAIPTSKQMVPYSTGRGRRGKGKKKKVDW